MTESVLVALIGLPASLIAALGAWRASRHSKRVNEKVDTGNGQTLARYVMANTVTLRDIQAFMWAHAEDDQRRFASIDQQLSEIKEQR